jgi:hypothetical protein
MNAVDELPPETAAAPADEHDQRDERPIHLAKCAECAEAVRYRPSVSGASFTLVDDAPGASYGIGEHGRPLCPGGHGEMTIADDQLKPAHEAVAEVIAKQADTVPVQRSLPGVVPVFNFEGAYKELEDKAVEVDALHREYQLRAEDARDAKKRWDGAAELYTKMALEFRRRRQAKVPSDDAPPARSPRLVKCTWEAQHADETCPLCNENDFVSPMVLAEVFGNVDTLPPADAEAHVADVEKLPRGLETRETVRRARRRLNIVHPRSPSIDRLDGRGAEGRHSSGRPAARHQERRYRGRRASSARAADGARQAARAPRSANDDAGYEPQRCSICDTVLPRENNCDPLRGHRLRRRRLHRQAPKAKGTGHHYPAKGKKKSAAKGASRRPRS